MPSVLPRLRFAHLAVLFAALFSAHLVIASSGTANVGQSVTFSVTVNGTAPFTYQWYKDSAVLTGGTNATYTISSVVSADAGTYYVVVANSAGSSTSDNAVLTVSGSAVVAPSITTQPSTTTVNAGQSASFSVVASGTAPLTYQWRKDGSNISGATSATYTISSTQAADAASYSVIVTNSAGSATSSNAALTVNVAPSITTQPSSLTVTAGQSASFSVVAGGTAPLTYQWRKDGSNIGGATSATYSIASTQASDAATYSVVVTNTVSSITSNGATLAVNAAAVAPSITTQPASATVNAGQSASFSVVASGTAPLTYQWRKGGTNISGATSATYTISSTQASDAASYSVVVTNSVGSATSNNATLTVNVAPSITTQPSSLTVTAGQSASFSVVASGTAPLTYQWRKGGTNISGATSATYTISNTQASDAASYSVVVTNSVGSATSNNATLTVNVAPSITTQPASAAVNAGQSASFSVVAGGTAPLTYQWRKGGTNISGATSATYTISSAQTADAASYSVVVTNSVGSATSNNATLTVNVAPSITTQPASATVNAGQSASFSVVAGGTAPLTYQWRKDGTNISGATSATHTISSTQASDAASYSVVVTNSVGSVTSNNATLTVNVAPSITSQPASLSVTTGQSASFSVVASGTAPLTYQWRKDGTNIGGATSATYTISSAQTADAANYSVVVTNSVGSASSSNASLTVTAAVVAPAITTHPSPVTVAASQSVSFSVVASGTAPLTYQWRKDGTNIGGAASATYTISSAQAADAGSYSVVVTNSAGAATSNAAALTVNVAVAPSITSQPSSLTVTAGQSASFSAVASGTAPLIYQWRKDGANLSGATNATYTISSTQASDAASYSVVVTNSAGSATSSNATLTVNAVVIAPAITTQPSALSVIAGQSASLSVVASGTAPLSYQWRKDGVSISGATSATYTIASTQASDAATYSVVVANSAGSATSNNATLTVTAATVAPSITTQPSSLAVTTGNSASFTVVASGTAPLTYQWRKAAANISGATSASYTISSTQASDAASYSVVVTNSAGSATSSDATLTVTAAAVAPTVTTQPSSLSVTTGNSASFTVVASGTAPLSYQWRKDGTNISGANSATYTISSAQSSDAGTYSVVVSNSAGSATSSNATLTVVGETPKPPSNQTKLINLSSRTQVGTGSNITISGFVVAGTQPKTLLIRGIGPALADYGVSGVMTTPTMTVFAGDTVIATNEGWKTGDADRIRAEAQRLGAFTLPENGRDCAILADFAPGIYTVHLKGKNDGTGVGLIELYDANAGSDSKLINLSVRAFVGRDENMLITGLVVSGPAPKTILVRAVGPGLTAYGVDGVLARPRMALVSGQQEIASNTGWTTSANRDAIASVAAQVGAFPLDPTGADSAMLLTLDPGIYTIQVKGANGETGTALVESDVVD